MMIRSRWKHLSALLTLLVLVLSSCTIKDDFALPLRRSQITSFEVEGQCGPDGKGVAGATINNETRTIDVYVCDTVDIRRLKVLKFAADKNAIITVEGEGNNTLSSFPEHGVDTTTIGDVRLDFTQPVKFVLHTYQEYEWTVNVHQIINREVSLSGQVGHAVIDPINENVIVYVSTSQSLIDVKVHQFTIGGEHGTVSPDPTLEESCNFSRMATYDVKYGYSNEIHQWHLFVYQTDAVIGTSASAFARSVSATISGNMQNGTNPVIEYRVSGTEEWNQYPIDQVDINASNYTAELTGLAPNTTYDYRVTAGESATSTLTFTTAPAEQLENSGFDRWSMEGSGKQALYNPWGDGDNRYWDTGNRGATTVGASNSTYVTEGDRTYANLQSKYIVIKFAAGNVFTGEYLRTDGTNGILSFGRPFKSFPTHLQFDYKYHTSTINRGGGKWEESYSRYISRATYDGLRGQPDTCQVFIALIGDQDEEEFNGKTYPFIIRTRPSELKLFNPNSDNVIAYAQISQGRTVEDWTTEKLPIHYRQTNRTPKYIIVVASSSKFGDYFVGGDESLLQLDNMKLLYE